MVGSILSGAVLLNMILGMTVQSWGSFTVYATSYLRLLDPDIEYEDTAWVTAITGSIVGFTSYFGGWLLEIQSPQIVSLVGGFAIAMGVYLSSFTIKQGLLSFLFTYALVVGLGCGIIFPAPLQVVTRWLPKRQGFTTGLVMCGSAIGPMLATALQTYIVNPDNRSPRKGLPMSEENAYFTNLKVLDQVPYSFVVMAFTILMLALTGSYLIANQPSKLDAVEGGSDPDEERQPLVVESVTYTPSQVLQTREFWLMWFCFLLNMLSVNFAMNNVKVFGQTQGKDMTDHSLSTVVSAAALFNGLGRLAWGYFGDQTSFRLSIIWMSIIKALSIGTLAFSAQMGYAVYFFSVAVMFSCVGGVSSIWAGTINTYFGPKHFGRNFGLITTAGGLGWILGAAVFQVSQKFMSDMAISWFSAGFSFAGAVCGFLMRDRAEFWKSSPPE